MEISCALASSVETPAHAVLAEDLGYARVWLYDTPAFCADVWTIAGLCAANTRRIGIGPGVLVPSLRHPLANAAAIATLVALAPGRVSVSVGSGFTGRLTLGQRPLGWTFVRAYVEALRGLLRGEEVDWEGGRCALLHEPGFTAGPVVGDLPFVIGAGGPKGFAVARDLADGVFIAGGTSGFDEFDRVIQLTFGTVLDPGEDPGSARALAAAGHGAAVAYHALYDQGRVAALPGGADFARALDAIPAERRHLELHRGHLIRLNDHDREVIGGEQVRAFTFTGEAAELRERLSVLKEAGVTEIAYQPAGADISRELRAFVAMAHG